MDLSDELLEYLPRRQKNHGNAVKDLTRRKAAERMWKLKRTLLTKSIARSAKTPSRRRMYRHLGRFNSKKRGASHESLQENILSIAGTILWMLEDIKGVEHE